MTCSNALSNIVLASIEPKMYITDENAQGTEVTTIAVRLQLHSLSAA